MTLPAFLIGFIIAAFYGALFHFIRGGGIGRLILFVIVAEMAFWFGHLIANIVGFTFLSIGALRVGLASLVTLVALVGAEWLSAVEAGSRR